MATDQGTTGASTGSTPVACALHQPDLEGREKRWEVFAARALTEHANTPHGVRLSFRPGPGTEDELRALAAAETECCSWATWTVHAGPAQLILNVSAAGEGASALHLMFAGLQPSAPPA